VDLGVRGARRVGDARGALEVVGFASWARDLITFVPVGAGGRLKATNIGQARLAGVEVDARGEAGPIEVRAAYTGLVTANESACTAVVGRCDSPVLPGRPEHDLVADAIAHAGPASVRLGVDAVSGMFADLAQTVPVPARALVSAGARLDVTRRVRIAVDVRNVLDARAGTYAGATGPVRYPIGDSYDFPLPGRSVLVSARFDEPGLAP
jgi:outer membrane receptor protein involved in Fe transport